MEMFWRLRKRLAGFLINPRGYQAKTDTVCPNLTGDRHIEYAWIASHVPQRKGQALDFGNGGSYTGLIAAQSGYSVTAFDAQELDWPYEHPSLQAQVSDILHCEMPIEKYDLIINCSAIEHVGLPGRYVSDGRIADGDLTAMKKLRFAMKTDGVMLLTVPVGIDSVLEASCTRVYGEDRLPLLLEGFNIDESQFWAKARDNRWKACSKAEALAFRAFGATDNPLEICYALGLFCLSRA